MIYRMTSIDVKQRHPWNITNISGKYVHPYFIQNSICTHMEELHFEWYITDRYETMKLTVLMLF